MLNSYIGRMVAIYGIAAFMAIATLSLYLDRWFDRQIEETTADIYACELCPFEAIYQEQGLSPLLKELNIYAQTTGLRYRLDKNGVPEKGDLPNEALVSNAATYLEQTALDTEYTLTVEYYKMVSAEPTLISVENPVMVRQNLYALSDRIRLWGAIIVLIGFGMTSLIAWRIHWKMKTINQTASSIIARQDLAERIPQSNGKSEFDRLTRNLNLMLSKIQAHVEDMRHMSNNIAHDLRTPLTRLKVQLDQLPAENDIRKSAIGQVDQIITAFDALLRISHLEAGTAKITLKDTNLSNLLDDVIDLYGPLAEQKQQKISGYAEIAQAQLDRDLIFQALANLIENAIKFSPNGGAIQISVRASRTTLWLTVHDNGPGITENMLNKASDRFIRLDDARSTEGFGLGLSLTKAIAIAHQGKLELENHAKGFEARLVLPKLN